MTDARQTLLVDKLNCAKELSEYRLRASCPELYTASYMNERQYLYRVFRLSGVPAAASYLVQRRPVQHGYYVNAQQYFREDECGVAVPANDYAALLIHSRYSFVNLPRCLDDSVAFSDSGGDFRAHYKYKELRERVLTYAYLQNDLVFRAAPERAFTGSVPLAAAGASGSLQSSTKPVHHRALLSAAALATNARRPAVYRQCGIAAFRRQQVVGARVGSSY